MNLRGYLMKFITSVADSMVVQVMTASSSGLFNIVILRPRDRLPARGAEV
jgi:hypothetical protein